MRGQPESALATALQLREAGADELAVADALGFQFTSDAADVRRFWALVDFAERARGNVRGRWYCGLPGCGGDPHEGMHWCDHDLDGDEHTWECRHARADQCPPGTFGMSARIWLLLAGRGFGKSRAGAEWVVDQARRHPGTVWAAVGPRREDTIQTMIEGESGMLRALGMKRDDPDYNKSNLSIRLPNGSLIRGMSSEAPISMRGPNLSGVWLEEIRSFKRGTSAWDDLFPAIRRGDALTVVTTTPAGTPLVREFAERTDGSVVITTGATFDNEKNLSPSAVAELRHRWAGTRRERQELYGELFDDVPGALWAAGVIESTRGVLLA